MHLDQKIPTCFDISPQSIDLINMMKDDKIQNQPFLKKLNEMLCLHKRLIMGESTQQILLKYVLVPSASMSNHDLTVYLFDKVWCPNLAMSLGKLISKLPSDRQTLYKNQLMTICQTERQAVLDIIPQQP